MCPIDWCLENSEQFVYDNGVLWKRGFGTSDERERDLYWGGGTEDY